MLGKKMLTKIIFCIMIFLLVFSTNVYAANLSVTKTSVSQINFGEILEVKIEIENLENSEVDIEVKEFIENADPIDPDTIIVPESSDLNFTYGPSYYSWIVTIDALSTHTIIYKIKPLIFGDFGIGPTQVEVGDDMFFSNNLVVKVLAKTNGICEPENGENYINNPTDCPSGSEDNMCDLIQDGICDPDCVGDADIDCIKSERDWTTILIIVTIVIAVIFLFLIIIKKRSSEQVQQQPQQTPYY